MAVEPPALVIADGPLRGRRFPVATALWLGRERSEVDVLIDDAEVSRRHAYVRPVDGVCEIADAGSANGTFVNGIRLEGPARLADGDLIRIGDTTLRVDAGTRSQAATRVAPAVSARAAQEPIPALVVQDGPLAGRRFEVRAEVTLGREGTDIEIADPEVSRKHARVVRVGDRLEVVDEGSVNGTFVNGSRIDGRAAIANGDVVRIGPTSLQVEVAPSPRDASTVVTARPKRSTPPSA